MVKIINLVVHPDQSRFMPSNVTVINLCRLFISLQAVLDNRHTDTAVFAKVFDSLEWGI